MRKRNLTEFGKEIKVELIIRNQSQTWLIEQVRQRTDQYIDTSNLYKLMTGQINNSGLTEVIAHVLGIKAS